jgi:hypothetical protein
VANSVFMRLQLLSLSATLTVAAPAVARVSAQAVGAQTADPHPSVMQVEKSSGGFVAHNDYETLEVTICGDTLVHVVGRPIGAQPRSSA